MKGSVVYFSHVISLGLRVSSTNMPSAFITSGLGLFSIVLG